VSEVLTLRQLAEHLQLSERTIYRLLGRGQLPGFKVGGHWRFRRAVVDYWMDLRIGRMSSAELHDIEQDWPATAGSPTEALTEANALLRVEAETRREIVSRFIQAVTFPEPVDVGQLLSRVWEREQLASTATDGGVAFLHTARWDRRALQRHDLLAIGRLPRAVDFGAVDGGRTDVLFLLLARDPRRHLVLLAKVVRLCREPGLLQGIRAASEGREVRGLVRAAEQALFSASPMT
jgi:nitrogen PTS system EIIA component